MESTDGLGGSQVAAARDLAELPRLIAEAAAAQKDEDLRAAPRHGQQRTPRTSPQKPSRQTPNAAPHGRRRTGDAQAPGAQAPGAAETTSSEGGLTGALGQAADQLSQMLVDQEVRATTSEGRLRTEDAEARDQDGDRLVEEAPPAEAAPAAAPAAASAWCEDDELVLAKLKRGCKKHGLSLGRLRACATRHGLTIENRSDTTKLKNALQALKPAESSDDMEEDSGGIVPGARVLTQFHGAGTVLEGRALNGRPRVRLDVPRELNGAFESTVAVPEARLTRLEPGDVGYEASSTTGAAGSGAAGSGAASSGAAGSGAAAVHMLKVRTVLEHPEQHALGFAAPEQVVAPRAAPELVVPLPLLATRDPDVALGRAADDAFHALREHESKLETLQDALKQAEDKLLPRNQKQQKDALVKAARDAVEAEEAKGQQLKDAFTEASLALDAASLRLCPALAGLVTRVVDPLRADEIERAALRRRVAAQLAHAESDAAKELGKTFTDPFRRHADYDVAPHRRKPPLGVLALQCPRGTCQARYWFKFKEIHDHVMREGKKKMICRGCGFRREIRRGEFGDRRAREDEMDDELERWGVDYA